MRHGLKSIVLMLILIALPIKGQEGVCPIILEDILSVTGDACGDIDRNEACYGNSTVQATWRSETAPVFDGLGDRADVTALRSLITSPLTAEGEWGIALLSLQANLPDTLPGQNVTFVVYGGVALENEVDPDDADAPTIEARAINAVNVRSGPGTEFAVVGGLQAGDTVIVDGRNAAGDWLRIVLDAQTGWAFAPLMDATGDAAALRTVEGVGSGYRAPMQAFRMTSGVGESRCVDVPSEGVLVQAPQDTTVNFRINGVDVSVGSTGMLTTSDDALTVSTFDGEITVTSDGETQVVEPGFETSAARDSAPGEPEVYDYDRVRNAPVDLLPDPVGIPVVVPGASSWVDSGVIVNAGDRIEISASGGVNPCAGTDASACVAYGPAGGFGTPNDVDAGGAANYPAPDVLIAALIGRIGDAGEPFVVGAGGVFFAEQSGTLQLVVNDVPIDNNTGAFVVQVVVSQAE